MTQTVEERRAEAALVRQHELATAITPEAPRQDEDRAPYVLVARYRKARAISKHLLTLGATTESTIELGKLELGRQLASTAAGVKVPSETTWALVVELVREVRP